MDLLGELTEDFRSGEALASDLGVSRAAVSKAARGLIEDGYPVEVERADGYRLRPGTPTSSALAAVRSGAFGREYRYEGTVDSTQDELRTWAEEGAPEGAVVLAERQLRGRGRYDRTWDSQPGFGLTFSVLMRPSLPVAQLPLLSLAAGVGLVTDLPGELKWPNDVLVDGRKLAGILVESRTKAEETTYVLLGVGYNVDPPAPAGGIAVNERQPERRRVDVLAALLAGLSTAYERASEPGWVVAEWKKRTNMIGAPVRVETSSGAIIGRARDVDPSGALVVETDHGVETVHAGDVTLVRKEGTEG